MITILTLCAWILCAPLGYIAARWANRMMGLKCWTQLDRLGAILMSLFYGPLMPVFAVVLSLIAKLVASQWASRDAKW
jgi:MFS-type transporter involved in bile tolerance (Atg22 family)